MKKVLFDTNIILDIALEREPFFEEALNLFEQIDEGNISPFITATTITDIYYISKKVKGHIESLEFIAHLVEVVNILGIDKAIIINALSKNMKDFEDAIQITASEFNSLEYIITRNKSDFKNISSIKVLSAAEILAELKL